MEESEKTGLNIRQKTDSCSCVQVINNQESN